MKKIFYFALAATLFVGCEKNDAESNGNGDEGVIRQTLTFEGDYWNALIDSPQYDGALLYPENDEDEDALYSWSDEATGISSTLTNSWYDNQFWGGGIAISNYASTDIATYGDYLSQLTVYGNGGHSGTNFAIVNGYFDKLYGDSRGSLDFKLPDTTVESIWVCPTTYFLNVCANGNGYAPAVPENATVTIVAYGYDLEDGVYTNERTTTYRIAISDKASWGKWDLSALGVVSRIRFDITWDLDEEMGMTFSGAGYPAYFAFDDVTIVRPNVQ